MLELIGPKSPSKNWRDKEVRLSACAARVFVDANESAGGNEALVLEDGTCLVNHKLFLKLLKMHSGKKNLTIEVDERRIKFATTQLPVTEFSRSAKPPAKFKIHPVTDNRLASRRFEATQVLGNRLPTRLPNAGEAIIERGKIVDYLLNSEHRLGASKARFFSGFGFSSERWEALADALRVHGQTNEVMEVRETGFGQRYAVDGKLDTPDGRRPMIRSVWQLDKDAIAPKLVTAYPLESR
jgi:hypothetical protein